MSDLKYEIFIKIDTNDGDYQTSSHKIDQETAVILIDLFKKLENSGFGYYWCVDEGKIDAHTLRRYDGVFTAEELDMLLNYIGTDEYGYCSCVENVKMVPLRNEIIILP